jgi:hypothetical protein
MPAIKTLLGLLTAVVLAGANAALAQQFAGQHITLINH